MTPCCPLCAKPLHIGHDGAKKVYACPPCGYVEDAAHPVPETALKLPGLDRGRQQKAVVVPEKTLVQSIRQALMGRGYLVERVGQYRANLAGSDRGVADLLVRHPRWSRGMWLQLEVKTPTGAVSPAQRTMESIGGLIIVRSVQDALSALEQAAQIQQENDYGHC